MNFDKENWRDSDLNVDSLWIIGPRAKGGKHTNIYHGNFAPQIPNNMIRRFTEEKDVVLDLFMGSGTTGVICVQTDRDFIGIELNENYYNVAVERIDRAKYKVERTRKLEDFI